MAALFPTALVGQALDGTFRSMREPHARAFATDSGLVLRSKLPGLPRTSVSFARILTTAQVTILENFYDEECAAGAAPFHMPHPATGTMQVFYWELAPSVDHITNDLMRVGFTLTME